MTEVCHYCGALKNHGETKGMCLTNVPDRATARDGGAQLVTHKMNGRNA
jgi:hypothetical protein